jgi:hypothetical protein
MCIVFPDVYSMRALYLHVCCGLYCVGMCIVMCIALCIMFSEYEYEYLAFVYCAKMCKL